MDQTMTVADSAELIADARGEGILGDGLEAFCALEELLADGPEWVPQDGETWAETAERRPDLVEAFTERAIEQEVEPAEIALDYLVMATGGFSGGALVDEVIVACELAAQTAFAATA